MIAYFKREYIMSEFNPGSLKVRFKDGVGVKEPINPRVYTLTHSDETGELFLTVGKDYDFDSINYEMRDEVLAYWEKENDYVLKLQVKVDIGKGINSVIIRDKVFRQELPLAIKAIVFGDTLFLENNKKLYDAPIIIRFDSEIPEYESIEQWGKISDYKYDITMDRVNSDNYSEYNINPIPIVPPIKNVYNKVSMFKVIENALLLTLDKYIASEVYSTFGKNASYCLRRAEVLDAKVLKNYGPCTEEYEVVIGLKVGKKPPFYNNMIITFIIADNVIKVKDVKNPRE